MRKILIIGNGFIGKHLYRLFSDKFKVTLTNRSILDITDHNSIKTNLQNKYNYVIFAAGIKDVRYCEKNIVKTFQANTHSIQSIAKYIDKQTKFLHISTDYIFDGYSGDYSENDSANPLTVYGKSKLEAEKIITDNLPNYINLRTAGVYSFDCGWLNWLLSEFRAGHKVEAYNNVYNTPTSIDNLAEMIYDTIDFDFTGTIHLSGSERTNRYDLFSYVARTLGYSQNLLISTVNKDIFPYDVSLNCEKYTKLTNKTPDNIFQGLSKILS